MKQQYPVQVYDVYAPSVQKAVALGGVAKSTPAEVVEGADVVLLMVVNAAQVDDFLFKGGAADGESIHVQQLLIESSQERCGYYRVLNCRSILRS